MKSAPAPSLYRRHYWFLAIPLLLFAGCQGSAYEAAAPSIGRLQDELVDLQAIQAVLEARIGLVEEPDPYLILDLPERELRLELRGVALAHYPIRDVSMNLQARRIRNSYSRIAFCQTPFSLERDRWFEHARTLALKDSTAITSLPDTTGERAEQIVRSRVLALLDFDRDLALALHGTRAPRTVFGHFLATVSSFGLWLRPGSGEGRRLWRRTTGVYIELRMEPSAVRTLAPNLREGTKLILRF